MLKKYLLLLFLLHELLSCFAQTPNQWMKRGNKSFDDKDYYNASISYQNALQLDSTNITVAYKYAEALRLFNEYYKAEKYYQYVYDNDKKLEFDECLFWLATTQKYNANYDTAKENFETFFKQYKGSKSSYVYKKARQEIKSCQYATKLLLDTIAVSIENLNSKLNTTNSEFAASLINDTLLYFSSLRPEDDTTEEAQHYFIQLYQALLKDNQWTTINTLDTILNSGSLHSANSSISKDNTRLYFSRCNDDFKCAIYLSKRKEGQWQQPTKLPPPINLEGYTSTQPMISTMDGNEVLFFVSDRPKGKGKLDIWYSSIDNKGEYSSPKNLGNKVNTMDDEISPFYDSNNNTLYFSSNWHWGLGGFDIFKSIGKGTSYSTPENIGYPFNTSVNDFYLSTYNNFQKGFLTSNRKGSFTKLGETCCNDIYTFHFGKEQKDTTIIKVKEYTSLEQLNKYLPVTLYFHNDIPNPKSWDTLTTLNYMTTYMEYSTMKDTYKEEYANGLSDDAKTKAENTIEAFFNDYVDKGVEDLEIFTKLLLKELEKGQQITLTIKGYASPLAKSDYNVNLTLRRVSSLINYLQAYDAGVFLPYLIDSADNKGRLDIIKIPFGEYQSDKLVSDNLNDQQNSVYSKAAALERKIEIKSVTQSNQKDSSYAVMTFKKEIHDFGKVKMGEEVSYNFKFKNTGTDTLKITKVEADCGCTVATWTEEPISPGKKGEIQVNFDTSNKLGNQVKSIAIYSTGQPSIKYISITADIIEDK